MPTFLNLFGILSKQDSTESNTAIIGSADSEKEYVCDGHTCRPLERRSSVKANLISEIRNHEKKEKPNPKTEEHAENLGTQTTTEEKPATETTQKFVSCTTHGTQPFICRILALLRLKKLSSRCTITTPRKEE